MTNDSPITTRDMVYVDGFAITAGDVTRPPPGLTSDVTAPLSRTLLPLLVNTTSLVTDAATAAIEAVIVETVAGTTVTLNDPLGLVVVTVDVGEDGVQTISSPASVTGTYSIELGPPLDATFMAWQVLTERRWCTLHRPRARRRSASPLSASRSTASTSG